MLKAICKGMLLGAIIAFLLILSMSFLVEGADPLMKMLKDVGFVLMITFGSICGAINSAIYIVDNGLEKVIPKYALGAFGISSLFSILFLVITGELTENPLSFIILLLLGMTFVMGLVNLFFAGFSHMILKATKPNKY